MAQNRKKYLRILFEANKNSKLFINLERERGWKKDLGGIVGFYSLSFNHFLIKYVYLCM